MFCLSNGNSRANFACANFANVVITGGSTCGCVFGAFRVDDVTRQTRRHSPEAIFEKNVTLLAKFARVTRESREFGASGHSLVLLQYLLVKICS